MPVIFPPATSANEQGIVAIGGTLDVETIVTAYKNGIFPWPISPDYPLTWFSPNPRGILDFVDFHIPKSLTKMMKSLDYEIYFNRNFEKVIRACARVPRPNQSSTWISEEIIRGYCELFQQKYAYSVETYLNNDLVGGLYGVCIGEIITGESMFAIHSNSSKIALVHLIQELMKHGIQWIDTQMVTPVIASFGGKNVERDIFLEKLEQLDAGHSRVKIFGN